MFLGRSFNYTSKTLSLAAKVVVNQIVLTPVLNSYFFGMQALLAGHGIEEIWERIKRTVPTSFINSWKLWPAVTAFNFTYVQPQFRAVFAGRTSFERTWTFASKVKANISQVVWPSVGKATFLGLTSVPRTKKNPQGIRKAGSTLRHCKQLITIRNPKNMPQAVLQLSLFLKRAAKL